MNTLPEGGLRDCGRAMRCLRSAALRPFGLSPYGSQAKPAAAIASEPCNGCWHLGEACGHCAVCAEPGL
jgi:hypothetical protein